MPVAGEVVFMKPRSRFTKTTGIIGLRLRASSVTSGGLPREWQMANPPSTDYGVTSRQMADWEFRAVWLATGLARGVDQAGAERIAATDPRQG